MNIGLTVVIPHYNRADLLHETLASLCKQSFVGWKAIVVDDASDAAEWTKARQFEDSRVRFLKRTGGRKGPSRCRNIGLMESDSEYVMFVDSDDIVAPWCFEERISFISSYSSADFCVFPVALFRDIPGDSATLWNNLHGHEDLERFIKSDPPWHTSSPLWRREAIVRLGGFDEEIVYGDDADLHMRALFANVHFQKAVDALPDVFVRRASYGRITNTISESLLDSRVTRLEKGTQLVRRYGTPRQQKHWMGQYFMEAEFLLFNVPDGRERQREILSLWRRSWAPNPIDLVVVSTYLAVARFVQHRCYVLLRIARRLAISVLPREYFPVRSEFESAELTRDSYSLLKSRLS